MQNLSEQSPFKIAREKLMEFFLPDNIHDKNSNNLLNE